MAIFIGEFGDGYVNQLAAEYSKLDGNESDVYNFCLKEFGGGEYKIRLIDQHCEEAAESCDLSCDNPTDLGERIEDEDVFFVVRGKYGDAWNSDKVLGIAIQGAELLKSGSPEYFDGKKAKNLYLVMPHEPYTKQDHLFLEGEDRIEGEPITVRMNRRTLQRMGYDMMFTVFPHDYRREGWIRKVAEKGKEHDPLTDWRHVPLENRVALEDWRGFAWAIDPTHLFSEYIMEKGIQLDSFIAPDSSGNTFSLFVRKDIGAWETGSDHIDKGRSRRRADRLTAKKSLDPDGVKGKRIGMFDDWALTCGTIINGIHDADEKGAKEIHVFLVHGEFAGDAVKRLGDLELKNIENVEIHTTDTVRNPVAKISTAREVARRLHYVPKTVYE